jgi:hypothetical protein
MGRAWLYSRLPQGSFFDFSLRMVALAHFN